LHGRSSGLETKTTSFCWPASEQLVACSFFTADEIRESDIGTGAGLFEVRKIGDEFYTFIVDCKVMAPDCGSLAYFLLALYCSHRAG
jgi:hypothetical protein